MGIEGDVTQLEELTRPAPRSAESEVAAFVGGRVLGNGGRDAAGNGHEGAGQ